MHSPIFATAASPAFAGGTRPQGLGLQGAANFLVTVLDAIDYGVMLVDEDRVLHYANSLGRTQLGRGESICMEEDRVALTSDGATAALAGAVRAAVARALRTTLHLSANLAVAVIPAAGLAPEVHCMAALLLSRRGLCTPLALDAFAREHGLTAAESAVLRSLVRDETPESIAAANGVALCTVRTQVSSIRAKTCATSTRELLSRLARVPPLVSVLVE
jgi:DNA-binding CsgD family transcriptional regulator